MTSQMIIRMDSEIKAKVANLARSEGKTASQVVRELIDNYIKERDIGSYIDDLWGRIGDNLSLEGIASTDIDKAIGDVRAAKK